MDQWMANPDYQSPIILANQKMDNLNLIKQILMYFIIPILYMLEKYFLLFTLQISFIYVMDKSIIQIKKRESIKILKNKK